MKSYNCIYIVFFAIFFSYCHQSSTLFAQSKIRKHVGSSQFFDISGEWVNNGDTATRRITRMSVSSTIVNTFRIKPYFKLGKKELPAPSTPIQVSEVELCYTGMIADAKCFLIPTVDAGVQRIKVYSVIIDPAGRWTGMGTDILDRKGPPPTEELLPPANVPPSLPTTNKIDTTQRSPKDSATVIVKPYVFNIKDMLGHWKNEWQYEQIIPRLQVVEIGGRIHFKVYKLTNEKERALGTFPVIGIDKTDHAQIVKFIDGEVENTMRFRPIILDNQLKGIDLTIEEFYIEGSPKGIFRQFFVLNPIGYKIAAAEELIKQLEGEWENIDGFSPTSRLVVAGGEVEVWGKTKDAVTGVVLGKKALSYVESEEGIDCVGTTLPGAAFRRKLEIDVALAVNDYLKKVEPSVLVMTSYIEDIEGGRPNRIMTEVFRRKGTKIPPEAFGITSPKKIEAKVKGKK